MKYFFGIKSGLDMSKVLEIKNELSSHYQDVSLDSPHGNYAAIKFTTDFTQMEIGFLFESETKRTISTIRSFGKYYFHLGFDMGGQIMDNVNIIHQMIRKRVYEENLLKSFFESLTRENVEDILSNISDVMDFRIEKNMSEGYKIYFSKGIFEKSIKDDCILMSPNEDTTWFITELNSINHRLNKIYNSKLDVQIKQFPEATIVPLHKDYVN